MLEFMILEKYQTERRFLIRKSYGRSFLDIVRGWFAKRPKDPPKLVLPKHQS